MAVDASLDARIREWEERLAASANSHPPFTLTPAWWQERLLHWATNDPDFRVKLLRFVDVLPTLRSARSIADHVRQYFRDSAPGIFQTASGLASQPVFRPVLSRVVRRGVFSMAQRFIAGESPEAAVSALRELARDGVACTVDLLGEETLSDVEADAYLGRYTELVDTLSANAQAISRLVKGAYWDEERIVAAQNSWPVPVLERKEETDASFERCTEALLAAWPHLRPAFGSHNPRSVAQAMVKARNAGRQIPDIEFQMLYGMAEGLRNAVAAAGYRTRVYVPVGRVIPGMAYLVRRLLENTSNQAWFNAGVTVSSIAQAPSEERARRAEPPFRNAPPAAFFEPEERERVGASLARARRGFGTTYSLLIRDRRVSDRPSSEVRCPAEPATIMGHVAQATPEDV